MAVNPTDRMTEAKMDASSLYREEIITDRKVGTIRMLTPIKIDGTVDSGRPVIYMGEAQILTQAGRCPSTSTSRRSPRTSRRAAW